MAKFQKLTVEKWSERIAITLSMMGYKSFEEASADHASRIHGYYKAWGEPQHHADNFSIEAGVCTLWYLAGMQVYDFDRDFADAIINESWGELLPSVIEFAPHKAFYLKLPFNDTSEGCVVAVVPDDSVDFDFVAGEETLIYKELVSTERGSVSLIGSTEMSPDKWAFAHVKNDEGGWMIARYAIPSKIGYMYDETPLGEYPIELMLNAVAYLCSVNADINVEYRPPKISKPNPKKDKKRSFATWHSVGSHIGAQLREYERYKSEHNGEGVGSVRPHMRRAHFHHYWVGSKYARRLELRWLSPIKVGFGGIESTTLHRVQ